MPMNTRQELGSFMNAVCFQYLRTYTEEVAGRAPIVAAGRTRGSDVVKALALPSVVTDPSTIQELLNNALGADGTRLCLIQSISLRDGGGYEVRLTEGACTMGQIADEPICAFTLGVFVGAIATLTGQRVTGREVECQACGAPMCVYHIDPI
jgi:predicted hydrocarbon binding protein